jgi:hypothetical protein
VAWSDLPIRCDSGWQPASPVAVLAEAVAVAEGFCGVLVSL